MGRKPTQKDRVIQYIDDFGYITSWQAYADLGITQLGACIFYLKQDGFKFSTKRYDTTSIYGDPTWFVRYFIEARPVDGLFPRKEMQKLVRPRVAISKLEPAKVREDKRA